MDFGVECVVDCCVVAVVVGVVVAFCAQGVVVGFGGGGALEVD